MLCVPAQSMVYPPSTGMSRVRAVCRGGWPGNACARSMCAPTTKNLDLVGPVSFMSFRLQSGVIEAAEMPAIQELVI